MVTVVTTYVRRLLVAGLAIFLLAGCGAETPADTGAEKAITVELGKNEEFKFTPDSVNLKVGQPVALTLKNVSKVAHDLSIEKMPIKGTFKVDGAENHASGNAVLDVDVPSGKSAVVRFTPDKAGTFTGVCEESGHEAGGMTITFVVEP